MRVYLPATLETLSSLRDSGLVVEVAHAVTPALREWYVEGDAEELEYAALVEAAEGSLRLLAASGGAPRRRVVVAADVPDEWVEQGPGDPRSGVRLSQPVELDRVASFHVDDTDAVADVAAAVTALPAADAGDDDARFTVDGADGHDLLWYDVTELGELLASVHG